ncbi:MAG TPA: hypothetical protein DCR35_21000 [Runella sp.]|nr:hypothetical protein [Runella sp.]HAO51577.1 hypothetical protein [Runella sp.]
MKKILQLLGFLAITQTHFACFKEMALATTADFSVKFVEDNKAAPARVVLENTSLNADVFKWTFEGASITSSDLRTPPELAYEKEGKFKIILDVSNIDNKTAHKETTIEIGKPLAAKFGFNYNINNLAPATIKFTNLSVGATRYEWTFEKADKATSTEENPTATFADQGQYKVSLKAFSGQKFVQFDSTVQVGVTLTPTFAYDVLDFNFSQEAPLTLRVVNTSKGSTQQKWAVNDANAKITAINDSVTSILLPDAKTYKVSLTASNGKVSKTEEKDIVVNPTTNLLHFTDVKLGVYEASTFSSYFVSRRKQAIPTEALDTLSFGKELDIVFFSQDETLSYSRFLSPDKTESLLMPAVPKAQRTTFINLLEGCAACTKLTDAQFDGIKSSKDFGAFVFKFSDGVIEGFESSSTPRYVPFRIADGRLGVIKIKSFHTSAGNSYITTDIKVYRKP